MPERIQSMTDDLIIPWSEVRPGDLVLHKGSLIAHEGVDLVEKPWGDGTDRLFADVSHRLDNGHVVTSEYRADDLTAVRRESPVEWGTFIETVLAGQAQLTDIDEWVDAWHKDPSRPRALTAHLGLTFDEYTRWVMTPDALGAIVDERRRHAQNRED